MAEAERDDFLSDMDFSDFNISDLADLDSDRVMRVECSSYVETAVLCLSSALEGICFYIVIFRVFPALYQSRHSSDQNLRFALWFLVILVNISVNFYEFLEINVFRTTSWPHKIRFNFYFIGLIESVFTYTTVGLAVEPIAQLFQLPVSRRQSWVLFLLLSLAVPLLFLVCTLITWESQYEWIYIAWEGFAELTLAPVIVLVGQLAVLYWGAAKVAVGRETNVRVRQVILLSAVVVLNCINSGVLVMAVYSNYNKPIQTSILPVVIILTDFFDSVCKVLIPLLFVASMDDDSWISRRLLSHMNRKEDDSRPVIDEA